MKFNLQLILWLSSFLYLQHYCFLLVILKQLLYDSFKAFTDSQQLLNV